MVQLRVVLLLQRQHARRLVDGALSLPGDERRTRQHRRRRRKPVRLQHLVRNGAFPPALSSVETFREKNAKSQIPLR